MSFLNSLKLSLENEELLDENGNPIEVTDAVISDADASFAESETVRQEVEQDVMDAERAQAIVEEVEGTNDAISGAIERGDEITPTTAAMIEAQRRTAAVALGLDPDEGPGERLVDQAGLEHMVNNYGMVSLEENKGILEKIKTTISNIIKRILEGIAKFRKFIRKITNVIPEKYRRAYNDIKDIPEDGFKTAVNGIVGERQMEQQYGIYLTDGKPADIEKQTADAISYIKGATDIGIKIILDYVKRMKEVASDNTKSKEVYDDFIKTMNSKIKSGSFKIGDIEYTIKSKDYSVAFDYSVNKPQGSDIKPFTKKDLLSSLNNGTFQERSFNDLSRSIEETEKTLNQIKTIASQNPNTSQSKFATVAGKLFSFVSNVNNTLIAQRNAHIRLANLIKGEYNNLKGEGKVD